MKVPVDGTLDDEEAVGPLMWAALRGCTRLVLGQEKKNWKLELELSRAASHLLTGGRSKETAFFSFLPPSQFLPVPPEPVEATSQGNWEVWLSPNTTGRKVEWGTIRNKQHQGHEVAQSFQLNASFFSLFY